MDCSCSLGFVLRAGEWERCPKCQDEREALRALAAAAAKRIVRICHEKGGRDAPVTAQPPPVYHYEESSAHERAVCDTSGRRDAHEFCHEPEAARRPPRRLPILVVDSEK